MAVIKVIELLGISEKSWEHAVQVAVSEASKSVRGINGVDVVGQTADVKDGRIARYKANVKIAFEVER